VGDTLVRFNHWLAAIATDGWDNTPFAIEVACLPLSEAIETASEGLVQTASGSERDVLSKSLQEALFFCGGSDPGNDHRLFKSRLTLCLAHQGASPILQVFLSFYFFNFAWFETSEDFRAQAWSATEFEKDIEEVEAFCQTIVEATWRRFELERRPLDQSTAHELIERMEHRLRGLEAEEPC
jgi:hypothetical protein